MPPHKENAVARREIKTYFLYLKSNFSLAAQNSTAGITINSRNIADISIGDNSNTSVQKSILIKYTIPKQHVINVVNDSREDVSRSLSSRYSNSPLVYPPINIFKEVNIRIMLYHD